MAETLDYAGQELAVRGKAILRAHLYLDIAYGDRLRATGQLITPPVLEDLDDRQYLAARGVHSLLRQPHLVLLEGQEGSLLLRLAFRLKGSRRGIIEAVLPEPEAGLLNGLLLGIGYTLPAYLATAFQTTGCLADRTGSSPNRFGIPRATCAFTDFESCSTPARLRVTPGVAGRVRTGDSGLTE